METVRGVLLDVDGTLLDSNDAHARAWTEALHEHGYSVPRAKVRELIGMGGDKLLPQLVQLEAESDVGRAIGERRGQLFRERYLSSLQPCPGARALVQHLRDRGMTLVVASSASGDELAALLARAQVDDLLDGATSADDVAHSKPDPDVVQQAMARAGLPASSLVMLGDTPYDVEAALRAGVHALAVRCGGWSDRALRGASAIYDSPADLLARFEGSLLAS